MPKEKVNCLSNEKLIWLNLHESVEGEKTFT